MKEKNYEIRDLQDKLKSVAAGVPVTNLGTSSTAN
jgi:hypothetical protein